MVTLILRSCARLYPAPDGLQEPATSNLGSVNPITERIDSSPHKLTTAKPASNRPQKQVRFHDIPTVQEYLLSEADPSLRLTPLPPNRCSHCLQDGLSTYKQALCLQAASLDARSTFAGIKADPYLNQVALRRIDSVEAQIKKAIQLSETREGLTEAIPLLSSLAEIGYQKALHWMETLQAKNADSLGAVATYTHLMQLCDPAAPVRPAILHEFALLHKKPSISL